MPKLQALIFDLDGTLVDSAPDLRQALNLTLKAHGRRELTLDEIKDRIGDGMLPLVHRAFAATGAGISDAESYKYFQEFITHYRNQKADVAQIYPHVTETLAALHAAGVKLGVCTNKQEAATLRLMDELGLAKYFAFMAGGDTFPVHKPHPGHVMGVLDKLGVLAGNAAMVGDSSNDIVSARGAGVKTLAVTHGYGAMVEELGADALIDGFKELRAALEKLGFQIV